MQHFLTFSLLDQGDVSLQLFLHRRVGQVDAAPLLGGKVSGHHQFGDFQSVIPGEEGVFSGQEGLAGILDLVGIAVEIRFVMLHRQQATGRGGFFQGLLGVGHCLGGGIANKDLQGGAEGVDLEGIAGTHPVHEQAQALFLEHPGVGELRFHDLPALRIAEGDHPGGKVFRRGFAVVDAVFVEQRLPPAGQAPLQQGAFGVDGNRLQEGGRFPQRGQYIPAHRDAVTAHVAEHPAALAGGIPEPAFVGTAMLFGGSGQHQRSHAELLRGQLGQLHLDRLHEDLVLEIGGLQPGTLDQIHHPPRFRQITPEGFFTDNPFQRRAFFDRFYDLLDDRQPGVVRGKDRHCVYLGGHLPGGAVDPRLSQAVRSHKTRQRFRTGHGAGGDPGNLHSAHLQHRPGMELCHKPGADNPDF